MATRSGRDGSEDAADALPDEGEIPRRAGAPAESAGARARSKPERLRATVVAAELRGLARVAATAEPRRVVEVLGDFFSALTDVAVAHRAEIGTPTGTTLLLVFAGARPRREAATRGVRTAIDLQQAFLAVRNRWLAKGWEPARDMGLGVGVSTDLLLMTNLGLGFGGGAMPVGQALSRAARLCQGAARGECLIDEATYAAVRPVLDEEVIFTSHEVQKGREPVAGYRVQRRRAGLRAVAEPAITDPVCGVRLKASLAIRCAIAGRIVHFCSRRCAEHFAADPQKFAS